MNTDHRYSHIPVRRAPRKWPGLGRVSLPILAILSGVLLVLALARLLPIDGTADVLKTVVIGISATTVSYATNRFAVERGADLAARGYLLAGIAAFGSILLVGVGLFTATYSGLVIKDVEELGLQKHGVTLMRHAGELSRSSAAASQAAHVVSSIVTDVKGKATCEREVSCLSGRGDGGRGPVARMLGEKLGKAEAVLAEVERGKTVREGALSRVNDLLVRYNSTLARLGSDEGERRRQLAEIDALVRQASADMEAAAPAALLRGYASELTSGSTASDNVRLDRILRDHGNALSGALDAVRAEANPYPAFPPRAGVADTLTYIPHFLPVAAVTAVIELVFPIVLLVYRLLSLLWANYQTEHGRTRVSVVANPADETEPSPFDPPYPPSTPQLIAQERAERFTPARR